jgi:hypothetical protein
MTIRKPTTPVAQIPHSWTFATWPKDVYPNDGKRGRHVCRANKTALIAEGALSRVGRELVVLGAGYNRWLGKQAGKVLDFDVPANRPEHASKRNNGADDQQRKSAP